MAALPPVGRVLSFADHTPMPRDRVASRLTSGRAPASAADARRGVPSQSFMATAAPSGASAAAAHRTVAPQPAEDVLTAARLAEAAAGSLGSPQAGDKIAFVLHHYRLARERCIFLQRLLRDYRFRADAQAAADAENELAAAVGERDSWALVAYLHKADHQPFGPERMADGWTPLSVGAATDQDELQHVRIVQRLYATDPTLVRQQAIVHWLQHVETLSPDAVLRDNADGRDMYMFKTNQRLSTRAERDPSLIDQLDPDAPSRQKRGVVRDDQDEDNMLLGTLWRMLRRGQLPEAVQQCESFQQHWRAATLCGGRLWCDGTATHSDAIVEGNRRAPLWREMCGRLAEASQSPFEQAIYGVLSGRLQCVLPHCPSWHDWCWAHFHSVVADRVELALCEEVAQQMHPAFAQDRQLAERVTASRSARSKFSFTCESVFSELESSVQPRVRLEGLDPFHRVQRLLALHLEVLPLHPDAAPPAFGRGTAARHGPVIQEVHAAVQQALQGLEGAEGDARSEAAARLPRHAATFLRFAAHLCLYLRPDEREPGALGAVDNVNSVIKAYIALLIRSQQRHLVACYAQFLPEAVQIPLFVDVLRGVPDLEQRTKLRDDAKRFLSGMGQIETLLAQRVFAETGVAAPVAPATAARPGVALTPAAWALGAGASLRAHTAPAVTAQDVFLESMPAGQFGAPSPFATPALPRAPVVPVPQQAVALGTADVERADLEKIRVIQFFDRSMFMEAIKQANVLARFFQARDKLAALVQLFGDDVRALQLDARAEAAAAEAPSALQAADTRNLVHEFRSWNDYATCLRCYNVWSRVHYDPVPVPPPAGARPRTHEEQRRLEDERRRFDEAALRRQHDEEEAVQSVFEQFRQTLQSNWLQDEQTAFPDNDRARELQALRQKCLPQLTLLLLHVCRESNRLEHSLSVAALLADERYGLAAAFPRAQLQAVLARVAENEVLHLQRREMQRAAQAASQPARGAPAAQRL